MRSWTKGFADDPRTAKIQCVKNDELEDIAIRGQAFWLLLVSKGRLAFRMDTAEVQVTGPAAVCLDEQKQPVLTDRGDAVADSVYFDPTFLNVNMTFERVHSKTYDAVANNHDLFLLKAFTDEETFVIPLTDAQLEKMRRCFFYLQDELTRQSDWYWSCRCRSYFMEMLLFLERISEPFLDSAAGKPLQNPYVENAIFYIETHYENEVSLKDIADCASINRSTLSAAFKEETGVTPMEYLWQYRVRVAKKLLAFTNLPVKEIAVRCGFRNVPHFYKRFQKYEHVPPALFRSRAVENRQSEWPL
ncbi:MAG: helix-turn-helix transcriptional regulator [Clostridia bacterium]|nr:helix-turn-helix transcriptional regulator [Clostridia bacterium]